MANSHYQSSSVEVDNILSLPVLRPGTLAPLVSLTSCLQHYFSSERIDKRCNEEDCSCKESLQHTRIVSHPKVLLLHLIRHAPGSVRLGHKITFPLVLHHGPDTEPYIFTGALLHDGATQESGHYTHVTKCVLTGRLFMCSDDSSPVLLNTSLHLAEVESRVYVLVYSKEGATREAAARLWRLSQLDPRLQAGEVSLQPVLGPAGDSRVEQQQGTASHSGVKRGESFTPRQRVKLQMTAPPSTAAGDCPGCAAQLQGHQCWEDVSTVEKVSESVRDEDWGAMQLSPPCRKEARLLQQEPWRTELDGGVGQQLQGGQQQQDRQCSRARGSRGGGRQGRGRGSRGSSRGGRGTRGAGGGLLGPGGDEAEQEDLLGVSSGLEEGHRGNLPPS